MPRKPRDDDAELLRVHIWMNKDHWERLNALFGARGQLGTSKAVRYIISEFLKRLDSKVENISQNPAADATDIVEGEPS